MKRRYAVVLGIALGLVGSLVGFATVARTATEAQPYGPAIGPRLARDTGPGELLLAVVGGAYPSKAQADAANASLVFGDLQGYYVAPVDQFVGLGEQLGVKGGFALVSVFRTDQGAAEFVSLARSLGLPAAPVANRVQSFGGVYAGLGQEANLEGTGPLLGPIADSLPAAESET